MTDVNAFACGDGSIRVFAALMDLMDDDELMAIIGHEIGHVVHADTKHAMKNAYLASAARNAAGAAEGSALARLSESQLGKVVATFTDAQFSQKQEYEADEHGFEFCVKHGFDPYGMANSLDKLVELSKGAKASTVQKMFSSHPDSEKRAARRRKPTPTWPLSGRTGNRTLSGLPEFAEKSVKPGSERECNSPIFKHTSRKTSEIPDVFCIFVCH